MRKKLSANRDSDIVRRHQELGDFGSTFVKTGSIFSDGSSIVCELKRKWLSDKYHISHLWHLSLYLASPGGDEEVEICCQPLEFSGLNFSLIWTKKSALSGCLESCQLNCIAMKPKEKKNLVIASRLNLGLWVEFSTKESKRCNFKDCYQRETMINTVVSQPFGVEKPLVWLILH